METRPSAIATLRLLQDHRLLTIQRRYTFMLRNEMIPYMKNELKRRPLMVNNKDGSLRFATFDKLHKALKPSPRISSVRPGVLRLTVPRKGSEEADGDDEDEPPRPPEEDLLDFSERPTVVWAPPGPSSAIQSSFVSVGGPFSFPVSTRLGSVLLTSSPPRDLSKNVSLRGPATAPPPPPDPFGGLSSR